jgi:hypothetical protein
MIDLVFSVDVLGLLTSSASDKHGMGAHAVARDAVGGAGGAQESGNELTVRATVPYALELPGREAADVDVELVQSGVVTIAGELNLELQLILRDGLAAHRAGRTDPRPAPGTVGSSRRQLSSANH